MMQSGDWDKAEHLTAGAFQARLHEVIEALNVEQARTEVKPYVSNTDALVVWSKEFFTDITKKIHMT